jgi:phi LC3 family holin
MNINWKVRLQNKAFLASAASGILLVAKYICAANGYDLPTAEISNAVNAVLACGVALGVIVDPTTAGVSDSARALTYTEPSK